MSCLGVPGGGLVVPLFLVVGWVVVGNLSYPMVGGKIITDALNIPEYI